MFKRPSSRRKTKPEGITLNLVPILDTMVTLIAFLLFTMSFLSLVTIESPFPVASPKDVEEKIKERPLQLTITIRENETEIWSPFDRIQAKKLPNVTLGEPDARAIHDTLLDVKRRYPEEDKVVIVPYPGATYDVLISVMDAARLIDKSDTPIFVKNPKTGNNEAARALFPNVVFGNLLGDA